MTNLNGVDFTDADLSNAYLRGARVPGCDVDELHLPGRGVGPRIAVVLSGRTGRAAQQRP